MSDEQVIARLRDSRYLNQHHSFENVAALCGEAADRIHQPTTDDLLARFAAVAERLKGTGAPEVYEWILPKGRIMHTEYSSSMAVKLEVVNYEASLAGYVMWAMEVYWWACLTQDYIEPPKPKYHGELPAEWMLRVLESIADAIGGG